MMRTDRFLENLNESVRANPVAAGLIGVGLAWMLFGQSAAVARRTASAAGAAADTVDSAAGMARHSVAPLVTGAAGHMRNAASGIAETVTEGVHSASAKIRNAFTSGEDGRSPALTRGFADLVERQPLALGMLGIAVGAAIASAFPASHAEARLIGNAGERLRDSAKDAGAMLADRIGAVTEAAVDEAEKQNLTPTAAKQAMSDGKAKLQSAAAAARDAVQS